MLTIAILYAAMGALLGLEHYNDLRDGYQPVDVIPALIAATVLGLLWFPWEATGAAKRVWEQVS